MSTPLIMALSKPTAQSEWTPAEAYTWTWSEVSNIHEKQCICTLKLCPICVVALSKLIEFSLFYDRVMLSLQVEVHILL